MSTEVHNVWKQITELGLMNQTFFEGTISEEEFNELITKDDAALQKLQQIDESSMNAYVEHLTLDELLKLPFNSAQSIINMFNMEKRITILEELTERKKHYYSQMEFFGEHVDKEFRINESEFRLILSKIKHAEIVQNWLYGIS